MRRSSLKIILVIAALLCIIGGEFYYLRTYTYHPLPTSLQSKYFKKEKEEWSAIIDERGAKEAYQEFLKKYAALPPGSVHSLAHVFGELLYEKEGLSGVAICDSSFGFGCYHSFFGRAISEHGVEVVSELDKACVEAWGEKGLGCSHGIGHGLLWYMGDDRLLEALRICETLTWKGPIGGCSGGVFMEYNFHTMADPELTSPRVFDLAHAHFPCDALKTYREACYFDIPQWWVRSLEGDYALAGSLCRAVEKRVEREACFRGIGNIVAPEMKYDVARTLGICESYADRGENLLCRQGASWSFFAEPRVRVHAPELCSALKQEERVNCVDGSQIIR